MMICTFLVHDIGLILVPIWIMTGQNLHLYMRCNKFRQKSTKAKSDINKSKEIERLVSTRRKSNV